MENVINTGIGMDESSFELLFRSHFSSLCLFSMKYVHDLDTSKEIVHSVFVNLWEKRQDLDPEKSIKSYLFTSVYNRSLNYIRDQKKFIKGGFTDDDLSDFDQVDSSSTIEESELNDKIQQAIEFLPEKCKKIFLLNRIEGLKYKEISNSLNISVKTVEAQMSKALKILRERLKEYLVIFIFIVLKFFY